MNIWITNRRSTLTLLTWPARVALLLAVVSLALLALDPASAAPGDKVADRAIGQPDLLSNACNNGGLNASGLCNPRLGKALDAAGNLYVADTANNRVLQYNTPLTTDLVADRVFGQPNFVSSTCNNGGITASSLCSPDGVAVDAAGNLYVADFDNNRVLEYNTPITTNTVADTVFGQAGFTTAACATGAGGLCGPYSVDATSSNVYIADYNNNRVLEYDSPLTTNTTADLVFGQATFAGSFCNQGLINPSASTLCVPAGVALDGSGNLYVADTFNHRLLQFDTPLLDATADRVIGQPDFTAATCNNGGISASSLCSPHGAPAIAGGNLYVTDTNNNRVLEYDSPLTTDLIADQVFGQAGFTTASCNGGGLTASSLCAPIGVTVDGGFNVFVADEINSRVLEYDRPLDTDGDGIPNTTDNCPNLSNPLQEDGDTDGTGDVCDNCPIVTNPGQADTDSDTHGDLCDNCPTTSNPTQLNSDADLLGDACDNCPTTTNPDQANVDGDDAGDLCDNCPTTSNPGQANSDGDAIGNACDNCAYWTNPAQTLPDWPVPADDADCDGFRDTTSGVNSAPETYIGTDPLLHCAANGGADNEASPDAWAPDFNDNQIVNGQDVGKFGPAYGKTVALGPYGSPPLPGERYDWTGNGIINGQDIGKFSTYYGKSCA